MKKICIFVLMQFATAAVIADDCDTSKCPLVPKHYEEMQCEEVRDENNCCVVSFNCPDTKTRDVNKCFYKNETYEARDYLKKSELLGSCNGQCFCSEARDEKPAEFICAHIDCPEFFQGPDNSRNCVRQYDREHCCATQTVCDADMEKLSKCEFEGATYREGQKMYPKDLCYNCFCTSEYNSSISVVENPNCQKIDCGITLRNTARLNEGCVPVYYKKETCCPIGWRCPGDKHKISNSEFIKRSDNATTCKFGNVELNIGDKLDLGDEKCQECSCKVPPMIHCVEKC